MARQLLVVEDERPLREMMRLLLEDEGFEVSEAPDAETALVAFGAQEADLVLVDLRLPGMHGLELCRRLRQLSEVPIIIVTAQVDSHDVVAGLEAGADDYVTKPFVGKELSARIRAALRRSSLSPSTPTYVVADLEVRPAEGVVLKSGQPLHLTRTEFLLLQEFVVHAGLVLSREQLLENVWGYDYLGDSRLVDAHVRRLRVKIEVDPNNPTLLVTVRGLGYRLERQRAGERLDA